MHRLIILSALVVSGCPTGDDSINGVCGDGVQDPSEACDDGNAFDNDSCLTNCQPSRCGDGVRRQDIGPGQNGYEECDDGNQSNGDGCSNTCELNN